MAGTLASAFNFVRSQNVTAALGEAAEYKAFIKSAAEAAAQEAARIAPGREGEFYHAGADSFGMDSSIWHIIEYGSINNIAYGVMRRAVKNVGMRLDEAPPPSGVST